MSGGQRVRGVLFDSGGVLVGPRGGRWNPRYDFERIVLAHHPGTRAESFPEAFAAGQRVLDAGTTTANRTDYHRAMLRVLGVDEPSAALLRELEAPADGPVLELYPEVRHVLDTMRAWDVRMAVVSDPALVAAAIDLGYHGVALLRGAPPPAGVPAIDTLDELPPIVAGGRPPSGITRDPAAYPGHNRDHGEGS